MGQRLAELHAVLSQPTDDPAFAPADATKEDAEAWAKDVNAELEKALTAIAAVASWSDPVAADDAAFLLRKRAALKGAIAKLVKNVPGALKTRIHGDFHLGQVLFAQGDAYLIDFEGEPSRPLAERRGKFSPLRDVAGMIRSLDYARALAVSGRAALTPRAADRRTPLLDRMHRDALDAFLKAYRTSLDAAPRRWATPEAEPALLDLFLLQKAAYEVSYEAGNRVTWLPVPIRGLAQLVARLTDRNSGAANG
jgi:maltose alpha-D-glucosyltransferase/alpha-amylase